MTPPQRPTALTLALVLLAFLGLWGLGSGCFNLVSAAAGPAATGDMVSQQMATLQQLPGVAAAPGAAAELSEVGKSVAGALTAVLERWRLAQLVLAALGALLGLGLLLGVVRAWRARPGARPFLARLLWIAIAFTAVRAVINHLISSQTLAAMRPLMEAMVARIPGAPSGVSPQQIMAMSTIAAQVFALLAALLAALLYALALWALRRPDSLAWLEPQPEPVPVLMPEPPEG